MEWNKLRAALRVTAIYALFAFLWIYLSDNLLGNLMIVPTAIIQVEILKGFLFILVTSLLLYTLLRREFLKLQHSERALKESNEQVKQAYAEVEHKSQELALAYQATLMGWSKALELRDRETQGHTQRVTDLALRLATRLGVSEEQLRHLHRGAMLHDIGKMGIPDRILQKTGPLSEEEWSIMRLHPAYARDMLLPIAYLHPAIEIPYSHHERWDGEGYPQGLRGEQIPLAARIFALADVWDALCSNRPYRSAWPQEEVKAYIRRMCGKQFDPILTPQFLEMIEDKSKTIH